MPPKRRAPAQGFEDEASAVAALEEATSMHVKRILQSCNSGAEAIRREVSARIQRLPQKLRTMTLADVMADCGCADPAALFDHWSVLQPELCAALADLRHILLPAPPDAPAAPDDDALLRLEAAVPLPESLLAGPADDHHPAAGVPPAAAAPSEAAAADGPPAAAPSQPATATSGPPAVAAAAPASAAAVAATNEQEVHRGTSEVPPKGRRSSSREVRAAPSPVPSAVAAPVPTRVSTRKRTAGQIQAGSCAAADAGGTLPAVATAVALCTPVGSVAAGVAGTVGVSAAHGGAGGTGFIRRVMDGATAQRSGLASLLRRSDVERGGLTVHGAAPINGDGFVFIASDGHQFLCDEDVPRQYDGELDQQIESQIESLTQLKRFRASRTGR